MKKFQFRLQRVLRYYQQRQKLADVRLRHAAVFRERASAEVDSIQRQIATTCALPEKLGQLIDISAREILMVRLDSLNRNLTTAEENLKGAVQRFREAEQARAEITRQVEALLHLRTQQFMEHSDEVERQQQILLDEVVMRQWSKRDADITA